MDRGLNRFDGSFATSSITLQMENKLGGGASASIHRLEFLSV
jgi:hypothetical protein